VDNKINKLVMVFAICFWYLDRYLVWQ